MTTTTATIDLQPGYTVSVKKSEADDHKGRALVVSAGAEVLVDLDGQRLSLDRSRLIFIGCEIQNCTVYAVGSMGMGYHRTECKWLRVGIGKYAQYSSAVHISFLEKGKRKPRGFVQSYKPNAVVAAGHGLPEPPSPFTAPVDGGNGVSVSRSRHSSFGEGWKAEFDADILPALNVILNFEGHNSHENLGLETF